MRTLKVLYITQLNFCSKTAMYTPLHIPECGGGGFFLSLSLHCSEKQIGCSVNIATFKRAALPQSRLKHKGDQAFFVAALRLWNE